MNNYGIFEDAKKQFFIILEPVNISPLVMLLTLSQSYKDGQIKKQ